MRKKTKWKKKKRQSKPKQTQNKTNINQKKVNKKPKPNPQTYNNKTYTACINISVLLKGKLRNKFCMLCPNLSSLYRIRTLAKGVAEVRLLRSLQCPYAVWEV